MENSYKNPEIHQKVRQSCRTIYRKWKNLWTGQEVELQGFGTTFYAEAGTPGKPQLLLLHGTSSNLAGWMAYLPHWARDFHIIAPDLPGQPGLSSPMRPGLADGGMRSWLKAFIEALNLKKFAICGMSLGSWIAMDYALNSEIKPKGLVLITSGGFVQPRLSFLFRMIPLMLLGSWGVKRINRIVAGKEELPKEMEDFALLISKGWKPVMEPLPIFEEQQLCSLRIPLLYAAGTKDVLLHTPGTSRRIKEEIPHARQIILPDTGHVVLGQEQEILEFLVDSL